MDWLNDWLKNVIMVVMFAAFVELILPGKSMQKYARLVLSMLILLALLRPVVELLAGPPENRLALRLDDSMNDIPPEARLDRIMAEAEKIETAREKQSLTWAAEQMASQIKEDIYAETGERAVEVTVQLSTLKEAGAGGAEVRSVHIQLDAESPGEHTKEPQGTDREKGSIIPVTPVQVNIRIDAQENPAEQASEPLDKEAEAVFKRRTAPIKDLISVRWGVKEELIQVYTGEMNPETKW